MAYLVTEIYILTFVCDRWHIMRIYVYICGLKQFFDEVMKKVLSWFLFVVLQFVGLIVQLVVSFSTEFCNTFVAFWTLISLV